MISACVPIARGPVSAGPQARPDVGDAIEVYDIQSYLQGKMYEAKPAFDCDRDSYVSLSEYIRRQDRRIGLSNLARDSPDWSSL